MRILLLLCIPTLAIASHWWEGYDTQKVGIPKYPVIDLLFESAAQLPPKILYATLPLDCRRAEGFFPCVRGHQLLYNEALIDLELMGEEYKGSLPNAWYDFEPIGKPKTSYYTLAEYIITLDELEKRGLPLSALPAPTFLPPPTDHSIVTLMWPWRDPITKIFFSAGTRFVRTKNTDTRTEYAITYIDVAHLAVIASFVPKSLCIVDKKRSPKQARQLFVSILTSWLDALKGIIPYVWGGTSFVHSYRNNPAEKVPAALCGKPAECWVRSEKHIVETGLDCSGLIWRAALMARVHWVAKNSRMMSLLLTELGPNDVLEPGDIIWRSGHVMVVGSLQKNELIEAAGYPDGFGKFQRMALCDRFEGIETYADLVNAYREGKKLNSLTNKKTVSRTELHKILKLTESRHEDNKGHRPRNI